MAKYENNFKLGRTVVTAGVHERMERDQAFSQFVAMSLGRYIGCDWGDTGEEDKQSNDYAVEHGERILAAYIFKDSDTKIWIITEWDRSCTTILFPEEY